MDYKTVGRYKVEVVADSSGSWCGNALRFDDVDEARTYAFDLACRWFAVRDWRVFDTETGAIPFSSKEG